MAKKQQTKKKEVKAKAKITKFMLIGEVASKHPDAVEAMFRHGMHCIGCAMTAYETVEQGCRAHGMSDEGIDKMVEEMNEAVGKAEKSKK